MVVLCIAVSVWIQRAGTKQPGFPVSFVFLKIIILKLNYMKAIKFLFTLFLFCLLTLSVSAQTVVTIEGVTYSLSSGGTGTVVGVPSGTSTNPVEAAHIRKNLTYNGRTYSMSAALPLMQYVSYVKKLYVDEGFTISQTWTINYWYELEELWLPATVALTANHMVGNCPKLQKVYFDGANLLSSSPNFFKDLQSGSNCPDVMVPCGEKSDFVTFFNSQSGGAGNYLKGKAASYVWEDFLAAYRIWCFSSNEKQGSVTFFGQCSAGTDEIGKYDLLEMEAIPEPGWEFVCWRKEGSDVIESTDRVYDLKFYYNSDEGKIRTYTQDYSSRKNSIYYAYFRRIPVNIYNDTTLVVNNSSDTVGVVSIFCEDNDVPVINVTPGKNLLTEEVNVVRDFDASKVYYFSLPFDCDYDDITVTKNGADCKDDYDYDGDCNPAEGDLWSLYKFNEYRHSTANAIDGYAYDHIDDPSTFVIKRGIGYAFINLSNTSTDKITITFRDRRDDGSEFAIAGPAIGNFTISDGISYTTNSIPENGAAYAGWNLVGNPYYAAVSETDFQLGNHTWLENFVGYVSRLDENNNFERSRTSQANVVPALMSFFVKVPQSPVAVPVLSPYSTQRSTLRHREIEKNISLKLSRQGTYCDKTSVVINNSASLAYDDQEDLAKIIKPGAAVIYSLADDVKCEFNVLSLADNYQVIPLGLYVWQNGSFTFALDSKKTNFDGSVILVDNQKGIRTNLTNSQYTTNLSRGDIESRFYLEIEVPQEAPESVTPVEDILEDMGISTYVNSGVLHVDGIEELSIVRVVDAAGRQVASAVTADYCEFNLQQHGIYVVTINGLSVKVVY